MFAGWRKGVMSTVVKAISNQHQAQAMMKIVQKTAAARKKNASGSHTEK